MMCHRSNGKQYPITAMYYRVKRLSN